jgi:hypothetical protein
MKTAVEWLSEQYNLVDTAEYVQAKEMEKEQHKETFKQSRKINIFELGWPSWLRSWEQYYNETFKK